MAEKPLITYSEWKGVRRAGYLRGILDRGDLLRVVPLICIAFFVRPLLWALFGVRNGFGSLIVVGGFWLRAKVIGRLMNPVDAGDDPESLFARIVFVADDVPFGSDSGWLSERDGTLRFAGNSVELEIPNTIATQTGVKVHDPWDSTWGFLPGNAAVRVETPEGPIVLQILASARREEPREEMYRNAKARVEALLARWQSGSASQYVAKLPPLEPHPNARHAIGAAWLEIVTGVLLLAGGLASVLWPNLFDKPAQGTKLAFRIWLNVAITTAGTYFLLQRFRYVWAQMRRTKRVLRPRSEAAATQPVFGRRDPDRSYATRAGSYGVVLKEGRVAVVPTPEGVFLPGGGLEPGESPAAGLEREVREETGLSLASCVRVCVATEMVSASGGAAYEKVGAFFLCEPGPAMGERIEADHELLWLDPLEAQAALSHESQRWAVARSVEIAEALPIHAQAGLS